VSFGALVAAAMVTGCAQPASAVARPTNVTVVAGPTSASIEEEWQAAKARETVRTHAETSEAPRVRTEKSAPPLGSATADNQLPLNNAAVPFATYLNAMHNRIHPEFADRALGKLDSLPRTHPLNDRTLRTRVEIVVDGTSGAISKVAVVVPSRLVGFDVLVVDSLMRAGPFTQPPSTIRSADGNVYMHWDFTRDEVFACSTMHVRPFLLATAGTAP
jgi:hypothetical protein